MLTSVWVYHIKKKHWLWTFYRCAVINTAITRIVQYRIKMSFRVGIKSVTTIIKIIRCLWIVITRLHSVKIKAWTVCVQGTNSVCLNTYHTKFRIVWIINIPFKSVFCLVNSVRLAERIKNCADIRTDSYFFSADCHHYILCKIIIYSVDKSFTFFFCKLFVRLCTEFCCNYALFHHKRICNSVFIINICVVVTFIQNWVCLIFINRVTVVVCNYCFV